MRKILANMPEDLEMKVEAFRRSLYRDRQSDAPLYLMMNLETGCPLRCAKCALPGRLRAMGDPLSIEERRHVIDMAATMGALALVIIGAGEPSVPTNFRKLVQPVVEYAWSRGLGSVIFTTALGLDLEQVKFYLFHDTTIFVSLDSLNPKTYWRLTGGGNPAHVLDNVRRLRETYNHNYPHLPSPIDGRRRVRLGLNVTIQNGNMDELEDLRRFAGDDMFFVANVPMPQGNLRSYANWNELVGDNLEKFRKLAREMSETGSHTSVAAEGVCSYFLRGVAVDCDGELVSCGYAAETAHGLNVRSMSSEALLAHYHGTRAKYFTWCEKIGRTPSCPIRDENYEEFVASLCGKNTDSSGNTGGKA